MSCKQQQQQQEQQQEQQQQQEQERNRIWNPAAQGKNRIDTKTEISKKVFYQVFKF